MSQSRAPCAVEGPKPLCTADTGRGGSPFHRSDKAEQRASRGRARAKRKRTNYGVRRRWRPPQQEPERKAAGAVGGFLREAGGRRPSGVGRHPILCVKVAFMSLPLGRDQAVSKGRQRLKCENDLCWGPRGCSGGCDCGVLPGLLCPLSTLPNRAFSSPRPLSLPQGTPLGSQGLQAAGCTSRGCRGGLASRWRPASRGACPEPRCIVPGAPVRALCLAPSACGTQRPEAGMRQGRVREPRLA